MATVEKARRHAPCAERSYRAAMRGAWEERIAAGIEGLDFERELRASGETWAESDAEGRVRLRGAGRAGWPAWTPAPLIPG